MDCHVDVSYGPAPVLDTESWKQNYGSLELWLFAKVRGYAGPRSKDVAHSPWQHMAFRGQVCRQGADTSISRFVRLKLLKPCRARQNIIHTWCQASPNQDEPRLSPRTATATTTSGTSWIYLGKCCPQLFQGQLSSIQ